MIRINVSRADATLTETETLTEGRVGLRCAFTFGEEWNGLQKIAYFQGADEKSVAMVDGDEVEVPWECMASAGYKLNVGVRGDNASGDTVIPTVWVRAGKIVPSPDSGIPEGEEPTPSVVAQIQQAAANAMLIARGVREDADSGAFVGPEGQQGPQGLKGDKGDPGVYIGTTPPTDPDVTVWIDPSGPSYIYQPSQYVTGLPIDTLFLEKLNDTSVLLEPINLQTVRDCRLKGFKFRSGAKNHVVIDRCYFYDSSSNPTIDTPVFDFDSDHWVGSIKVIGCESSFRKYFITANSKDMTDVYFNMCTIEGAKKLASMKQNAIIRFDNCYIGDQLSSMSEDEPYITMEDNSKLIITNSQFGSNGKGGKPFIKCGSGCQVLIQNSNLSMTNQAQPYESRFINYGAVPFDGEIGCDFILDNVTWNVIPKRVNYNHNSIALACRKDGWRPRSNTPVKNYMKNPFFRDTANVSSQWVDVTEDSDSPFFEYLNPYGGHIYSCGNETQTFSFDWEIPDEKVGQNFYFILFINAQIGGSVPYYQGPVNCEWVTHGIMTGGNSLVAPNSLDSDNIYTPVLSMYGKLKCTAKTGKIGFGRNNATVYISGMALVAEEDIKKFPIYDNVWDT